MSEHDNPHAVPKALPTGYRFNEFEIREVIGGGGFGIVYRAWDHQLERTIAIKEFMPASLAVRNDDLKLVLRSERFSKTFLAGLNSFIQEARLLARFNHPNLLHVLRFWVQNDTAYMGTVFYTGTTLSQFYNKHREKVDEAWIRSLLPPLFGAINIIHREGYLHRDISLDNIQIQENGVPVLLDFGSARKAIGNLSDETETMLKPGFAPIEQYSDDTENEQGTWTDIYALGAVLHTLVVGSPPPVSVVRSIEDNYQPLAERQPQGYSLSLLTAIDRALALQPEDRPQTVDEFDALIALPPEALNNTEHRRTTEPGTMLVAVADQPEIAAPEVDAPLKPSPGLKRFVLPGLLATGVLMGVGMGVMIAGSNSTPHTASVAVKPAAPDEVASTPSAQKAAAAEPVAQVYLKLLPGDRVTMNGAPQTLMPSLEGFALLQLPAGHYLFSFNNSGKTRDQSITIDREGVWLLDPQS